MIPNWLYMSSSDFPDHPGSIQNLQRSPIPQTSNWSGTFFCCFLQQTGSSVWPLVTPLKKMVGFRDLVGVGFAPLSRCKCQYFATVSGPKWTSKAVKILFQTISHFVIIHFRLILKETNKKTRCKCDGLVLWWMSSVIEYLINVLASSYMLGIFSAFA